MGLGSKGNAVNIKTKLLAYLDFGEDDDAVRFHCQSVTMK